MKIIISENQELDVKKKFIFMLLNNKKYNLVEIGDNIYFVKKFIEDKKFNQKIQNKITEQTEQTECKDCDDDSISDMSDSSYVPFEPKNDIKVVIEEVKKVDKANKPKRVYPDKICDKCNGTYTYKNFARHYKKCEGR